MHHIFKDNLKFLCPSSCHVPPLQLKLFEYKIQRKKNQFIWKLVEKVMIKTINNG